MYFYNVSISAACYDLSFRNSVISTSLTLSLDSIIFLHSIYIIFKFPSSISLHRWKTCRRKDSLGDFNHLLYNFYALYNLKQMLLSVNSLIYIERRATAADYFIAVEVSRRGKSLFWQINLKSFTVPKMNVTESKIHIEICKTNPHRSSR